jgi:hypothetical protein
MRLRFCLFCLLLAGLAILPGKLRPIHAQAQPPEPLKFLAARPFTLKSEGIAISDALKELGKQTGLVVHDRRKFPAKAKIKLDLKDATAWQALDVIARAAEASVSLYQPDAEMALVDGPPPPPTISYRGLFRTSIKRISVERDLEAKSRSCLVQLETVWEPRFQPFLLDAGPCEITFSPDKQGKTLQGQQPSKGYTSVTGRTSLEFEVRVPAPDRSSAQIDSLRGKLSVIGPSKMLTFTFEKLTEIPKPAQAQKLVQEGITVTLNKLQVEDDRWMLEVVLDYPPGGPKFESFQSWLGNNKIYAENVKSGGKQRLMNVSGDEEIVRLTSSNAVIRYYLTNPGKKIPGIGNPGDWRLVYYTPGRIVEVQASFSFKEVALP